MVFILRDEDGKCTDKNQNQPLKSEFLYIVLYILGHNRTYTLGRSRQNDIRIRERSVSSMQAKITTNVSQNESNKY